MSAEHTPGPWKQNPHASDLIIAGRLIACVVGEHWTDEEEANARLIAAAPDLLNAAVAGLRLIDDMSRFVRYMALQDYALFNEAPSALQAAIAKATTL